MIKYVTKSAKSRWCNVRSLMQHKRKALENLSVLYERKVVAPELSSATEALVEDGFAYSTLSPDCRYTIRISPLGREAYQLWELFGFCALPDLSDTQLDILVAVIFCKYKTRKKVEEVLLDKFTPKSVRVTLDYVFGV